MSDGLTFVHPLAEVLTEKIGRGTRVWRWTYVAATAQIGHDCSIGQCCEIGPGVVIGDRVRIQNGVSVYEGVCLEDDVFIGPNATFANVKLPKAGVKQKPVATLVGTRAMIGANATILPGIVIGKDAVIGAGAVVTRSVPPGETWGGNPARKL